MKDIIYFVLLIFGLTGCAQGQSNTGKKEKSEEILEISDLSKVKVYKSVAEAIHTQDRVYRLDLSGQEMKKLSKKLKKLRFLQEIKLSDNPNLDIVQVLSVLKSLNHLVDLNLSNCNLNILPPEIGKLKRLKYLVLDNNNLEYLPQEIGGLDDLKILFIRSNHLLVLPNSIETLSNLTDLLLQRNNLIKLPDEIRKLSKLKRLNLTSNDLTEVPSSIGEAQDIDMLSLGNNRISKLPISIKNLRKLTHLDISENPIKDEELSKLKEWLPYTRIRYSIE